MLIGVSAGSVEEAVNAVNAGADYLGVGAMFPTRTKTDAGFVSMGELEKIRRAVCCFRCDCPTRYKKVGSRLEITVFRKRSCGWMKFCVVNSISEMFPKSSGSIASVWFKRYDYPNN